MYERKPFLADQCTSCGECLECCPVLHLPTERAQRENARLLAGEPAAVLRDCTSCMACNLVCPQDCRPANRMLDHWHAAYRREGLPARAAYFLPHSRPNFRTDVIARLPADERALLARWRRDDPAREFLYPGCNLITAPHLTASRLFAGLEIRGGLDYCCGEMLFRMGLYESLEQVAQRLTHWFRRLEAERVYLLCTAGLNMMRNVLPQFGADFSGIEFLPYLQVILERLQSGELGPLRPLGLRATVQDSCHARMVEPGFAELPRAVLTAVGVEVCEAAHNRETQLCCGIGGGFSHAAAYHPLPLLRSALRTFLDHRRVHADATCVYCVGCMEMLSVARLLTLSGRPVLHLLELVRQAIGETVRPRQGALARQFLFNTVRRQFPQLVNPRRFWLPALPVEPDGGGGL